MHVVATAGHVDHGKSTLVRLLTGMEPDRLAEERRRGLTIDLGFAWTTLPSGARLAFVDVPGHQRFVPTMLAGVGPVPAVLVVVAADQGWMPQSAEHLAAIDALGVRHGLLVVTRSDLADPGPALADAAARIAATSLGQVPQVAVSATTGAGLDELRAALDGLASRLPAADPAADVRLWIDRSFTVSGAGTVVTGTLPAGTLRTGDELVLGSTGERVRVRGLQALGHNADTVSGVARVAVNLRGVDRNAVRRGDTLLTAERWLLSSTVDVLLTSVTELPSQLVLHLGSAAVPARVRPLGTVAARLTLSRELPLRAGDRVLLRDPGRHWVLGGATVVDLQPPPLTRRGAARDRAATLSGLAAGPPAALAEQQVRQQEFVRGATLRAMGLPEPGTAVVDDWHADRDRWAALVAMAGPAVDQWRRDHPLDAGMPASALTQHLGLPDPALLAPLVRAAGLVGTGGSVRRTEATSALPARVEAAVAELTADLERAPFAAPDANRLRQLGLGTRELAAAVRAGRLLKVADGLVLLPGAVDLAVQRLATLDQPFTLSQARQAMDTSRRVAVPLMELLDREHHTDQLPDHTRRLR